MTTRSLSTFISGLPKAELHLHIEGSFEPELMFTIAQRNRLKIRFNSVEEVKAAYRFHNLQSFLDIYYEGAGVLLHEQDFHDLTWAYLQRVHAQNVLHTEIFFDPQTHTDRGVPFRTVIDGISSALRKGETELGISTRLIMSFLRHLDEASAIRTLKEALPFRDRFIGVGLDSSEVGNPPSKFERVFAMAANEGLLTVAHAGEEGPATYIREALDLLKVSRIDHGNRCLDDLGLVRELADRRMPLTLCPLSNVELRVIDDLRNYRLKEMMDHGLHVTLNSDDPAYFGGYMNENYLATAEAIDLSREEVAALAINGFQASFLPEEQKSMMSEKVRAYCADLGVNS